MESSPADGPPAGPTTDPASPAAEHSAAAEPAAEHPAQLRLRRAPRYRAFVLSGVLLGVMAALVANGLAPQAGDERSGGVLGYLVVSLGLLGALAGAGAALLAERRQGSRR